MIRSLYIHIPFCRHICAYCDFSRAIYNETLADRYLEELGRELSSLPQREFETAYIGGGTPTSLSVKQLERLFSFTDELSIRGEFTMEINPEGFTGEKAGLMSEHGINRVSIGVQSFKRELLQEMGRQHSSQDIHDCLARLDEAGITNRSIDLIYGFQSQTLDDLRNDLCQAVRLDIQHISIYDLEIHENTAFGRKGYRRTDDETDYLMYCEILGYLKEHGFRQYEVSNFCREGYRSRHNLTYWHFDDYYGAGLNASGKYDHVLYQNTDNFLKYLAGERVREKTELTADEEMFETVMMNLRLNEGISFSEFHQRFGLDFMDRYGTKAEAMMKKGLLESVEGHIRTTQKGLFVLNDILVELMD